MAIYKAGAPGYVTSGAVTAKPIESKGVNKSEPNALSWNSTPAKFVGDGGRFDSYTGGYVGAVLDVDNSDLFKKGSDKISNTIKNFGNNIADFWENAAKNLGKVVSGGKEMSIYEGMEYLTEAGFNG